MSTHDEFLWISQQICCKIQMLISKLLWKISKVWLVTFLALIRKIYIQNFNSLASKLREEFGVTRREHGRTTFLKNLNRIDFSFTLCLLVEIIFFRKDSSNVSGLPPPLWELYTYVFQYKSCHSANHIFGKKLILQSVIWAILLASNYLTYPTQSVNLFCLIELILFIGLQPSSLMPR